MTDLSYRGESPLGTFPKNYKTAQTKYRSVHIPHCVFYEECNETIDFSLDNLSNLTVGSLIKTLGVMNQLPHGEIHVLDGRTRKVVHESEKLKDVHVGRKGCFLIEVELDEEKQEEAARALNEEISTLLSGNNGFLSCTEGTTFDVVKRNPKARWGVIVCTTKETLPQLKRLVENKFKGLYQNKIPIYFESF